MVCFAVSGFILSQEEPFYVHASTSAGVEIRHLNHAVYIQNV